MGKKIVTVVGATGALGREIVKALLAQGAQVRAMVRVSSSRSSLEALGVTDFVVGDMLEPRTLKSALGQTPRADAMVASAAGYTGHTKGDTSRADTEGYRNLIDAAKAAGIPRFVLISILECDHAPTVPHFHHKYLAEKYLREKKQPYIALRPGAFLDQSQYSELPLLRKGVYPMFVPGVALGMVYTPDLARYAAIAATTLPESALNTSVDVCWSTPATGQDVADAFSKVLGKAVVAKPAFPEFMVKVMMPFIGIFVQGMRDMHAMVKWVRTGAYVSSNPQRQRELFGELPTVEEAVRRYAKDKGLI